ncbi:MAG: FISUMP domain-containing protein [Bacteroidota bacterium]
MQKLFLTILIIFLSLEGNSQTQRALDLRSNVVSIDALGAKGFGFITGSRNGKLFVVTAEHIIDAVLDGDQRVELQFFQDYNKYTAKVIRNYPNVDIALLEVDRPAGLNWENNCLGIATANAEVAFIGREGDWYVPTNDRSRGTIFSLDNNQIQVDITSVSGGTSGAPLVAESGIVGMITQTDNIKAIAVDLNQVQAVLAEYDYFFALTGAGLTTPTNINDLDTEAIYRDIRAFKAAQEKDDIPAYQAYIRDFASGEFRDKAITRIQQLEKVKAEQRETARWEVAQVRNDLKGYQTYLDEYPNGKYAREANQRIKQLQQVNTSTATANSNRVTDRDGNTYATKIMKDGKRWMTKNLNVDIPDSWCYNDDKGNCDQYGRLYTWEAAKKGCEALGNGWRSPSDQEWTNMAKQYGGAEDDASDGGKAAYTALLKGGDSGFSALLGGWRNSDGSFDNLGSYSGYWSSTPNGTSLAWGYGFFSIDGKLYHNYTSRSYGLSVRCLQDN